MNEFNKQNNLDFSVKLPVRPKPERKIKSQPPIQAAKSINRPITEERKTTSSQDEQGLHQSDQFSDFEIRNPVETKPV